MPTAPDTHEAPPRLDAELTGALQHEISRHARLLHVLKGQLAALVPEGLDVAAFTLLLTLVRCGPKRQGELAEESFLDPSTVSRHVAQLARAGYVQRRPHPRDGRAVRLEATEDGVRVAERVARRRESLIAAALTGWEPGDVRSLITLLGRLNDDLAALRPAPARATAEACLPTHQHHHQQHHHQHDRHEQEIA